jgi:hypothetical protein
MFEHDAKRFLAKQLFHEAYEAQRAENYEQAIDLYKQSIAVHPTAEAHTFPRMGLQFSATL